MVVLKVHIPEWNGCWKFGETLFYRANALPANTKLCNLFGTFPLRKVQKTDSRQKRPPSPPPCVRLRPCCLERWSKRQERERQKRKKKRRESYGSPICRWCSCNSLTASYELSCEQILGLSWLPLCCVPYLVCWLKWTLQSRELGANSCLSFWFFFFSSFFHLKPCLLSGILHLLESPNTRTCLFPPLPGYLVK